MKLLGGRGEERRENVSNRKSAVSPKRPQKK